MKNFEVTAGAAAEVFCTHFAVENGRQPPAAACRPDETLPEGEMLASSIEGPLSAADGNCVGFPRMSPLTQTFLTSTPAKERLATLSSLGGNPDG